MANIGPVGAKFQVTTTSSTAAFRDITAQVLDFSGFDFEAFMEPDRAFGISWEQHIFSQFSKINQITMTCLYDDDTSTGIKGIFGAASDVGAERVLKLNLGTTNAYPKFDFIHQKTRIMPTRNELTKAELTWVPTGAFTIVTT